MCAASAVSLCGCGYTTGRLLSEDIETIYVDNFKNRIEVGNEISERTKYAIYRPGTENEVTGAIADQVVFDGNLKLTKEEDADLILRGALLSYNKEPLRYDKFDDIEEYRISVIVSLELTDAVKDEVMWKEESFSGESTYKMKGKLAKSEETAKQEAIEDLARRVVERVVEGW